jgi:hypothetical protein
VKISLQVPIPNMDDFIGQQDFFFALAPLVLENEAYSNWFIDRPTVLDNGVHEKGLPVNLEMLVEASTLIGDKVVIIPPDTLFNASETRKQFDIALMRCGPAKLMPVLQGRNWRELLHLLEHYAMCRIERICIPYRFGTQMRCMLARECNGWDLKIHFLGLNSLEELRALRFIENASIDTGKPLRWAQHGGSWPGTGSLARAMPNVYGNIPKLDMTMPVDVRLAQESLTVIRRIIDFDGAT